MRGEYSVNTDYNNFEAENRDGKDIKSAIKKLETALGKSDGAKYKMHDLDDRAEPTTIVGFEMSRDGEKYAGGSYLIMTDGSIVNAAMRNADYGNISDNVEEMLIKIKNSVSRPNYLRAESFNAESFEVETSSKGFLRENLPDSKEERLKDLKEDLEYRKKVLSQFKKLEASLMPFTTGMVGHLYEMEDKMLNFLYYAKQNIKHYTQLVAETQEQMQQIKGAESFEAETFVAESFNAETKSLPYKWIAGAIALGISLPYISSLLNSGRKK